MTVGEAIKLLGYGTAYEIKGAYSGKVYHTYLNSSKHLDKYADREVSDSPFYADMKFRGSDTNKWCIPIIGIWMHDYDLVKENRNEKEASK